MSIIHEVAKMTAKGQITLPKAIRQALRVDVGSMVAFELQDGGQVVVSRADAEHEDPVITGFLDLLARDIQTGRHVRAIPDDLAHDMLEYARRSAKLDEDINGEVAL